MNEFWNFFIRGYQGFSFIMLCLDKNIVIKQYLVNEDIICNFWIVNFVYVVW